MRTSLVRGVIKADPHVPKDMSVIKGMRSYVCMCVIYFFFNLNTLLKPKGNLNDDIDFEPFYFKISVISSLRMVLLSVCMAAKLYE